MSDIQQKRMNTYTVDGELFIALINDEEQYSIWPAQEEVPTGWKDVGLADRNKRYRPT